MTAYPPAPFPPRRARSTPARRLPRGPLAAACLAAVAAAFGPAARPARAATAAQVQAAIDKAKQYLYDTAQGDKKDNWEVVPAPEKPTPDGQWHVQSWQWGGVSGCALYGLLAGGENPQDKRLAPAIEWLAGQSLHGHYAIAMRCQMYPYLSEVVKYHGMSRRIMVERDSHTLLNAAHASGPFAGFYPYYTMDGGKPQPGWHDLSISQLCVLGVVACQQCGADVPQSYWKKTDDAWKKAQRTDGGWPYRVDQGDERANMTAAGVATLNITQDYLTQLNGFSNCRGFTRNEAIERGMIWIDQHIATMLQSSDYGLYGMYGIERIGVASGRKYFGEVDWGAVGADYLVRSQNPDGSFGAEEAHMNPRKVPNTTWAILFLSRGRAPVLMNKLEYGPVAAPPAAPAPPPPPPTPPPAPPAGTGRRPVPAVVPRRPPPPPVVAPTTGPLEVWNERPGDLAEFSQWTGKQVEGFFTWQIINLKVKPADFHDAPILFIAGSEPVNFSDEEAAKLRQFAEDGGLILGNADCGKPEFSRSFVRLGQQMFPKYEFRDLPANHVIYTNQNFKAEKWKTPHHLQGLSNGVRELMILIPEDDLSRTWQTRSEKTHEDGFQLGFDLFQYAGGGYRVGVRADSYFIEPDPQVQPDRKLKVVRLLAGDNPDPEPGGWRRMAALLHNTAKVDLAVETAKIGEGKLKGVKVAHLTGTTRFKLEPAQQKELRAFIDDGGTLIVDAAGGSNEFAESAEAALIATFGGEANNFGAILPPAHEVYALRGAKIDKFEYRQFCRGRLSGHLDAPRVRGLEEGGRVEVYYSREDLSAGLVGEQIDGVLGYSPATATAILRNLVLYAAFGTKAMPPEAK